MMVSKEPSALSYRQENYRSAHALRKEIIRLTFTKPTPLYIIRFIACGKIVLLHSRRVSIGFIKLHSLTPNIPFIKAKITMTLLRKNNLWLLMKEGDGTVNIVQFSIQKCHI